MDFQGTSLNITTILLVALAAAAIFMLVRKRYESNLPLFFYFVALLFTNMTDRTVSPALMYVGLIFALLLRFEFMSPGFSKLIAFFATSSLTVIVWVFLAEIFGDGSAPF